MKIHWKRGTALGCVALETIRAGVRSFRRRKLFALTTILLLSLALAATNIMFTLIDGVLVRPLPFADPQRLAWLASVRPDRDDGPFSMPDYRDLRDRNRTADGVVAIARWSTIVSGSGSAERLQGVRVTSNIFQLLGIQAEAGRLLVPADDQQPDSRVVVLTDSLWRTRFGGDRHAIGGVLTLDGKNYRIVGVLPENFPMPIYSDAALMAPLAPEFHPWKADRDSVNFLRLFARLKPGVTLEQAQADMSAIARRLAAEYPDTNGRKLAVKAIPLRQQYTGNIRNSLLILMAAVLMVLFIACANLANLVLIQLAAREAELAIRMALGATRAEVVRQLATENLILAFSGGLIAFLITRGMVPVLIRFLPAQMPRAGEISVAGHVFLFSLAIAALAALLFGVLPALDWQGSTARLLGSIRGSTSSARATHMRDIISAGQIAISVILLISTALLAKSLSCLEETDLGFDPDGVLSAHLSLPPTDYRSTADVLRFSELFRANLAPTPGVISLGMVSALPLSGVGTSIHFSPDGVITSRGRLPEAQIRVATPGYLGAMSIAVDGRDFTEQDLRNSEPVIIINRALALRFWPAGQALGSRLTFENLGEAGQRTARIIGIASNVKQFALDEAATFDIYIPLRQMDDSAMPWIIDNQFWVVRTALRPAALGDRLREALSRTDRGAGASHIQGLGSYVGAALSVRRFNLALIAAFGITSLLLAITGVYAVLSYSLVLRSREIGTRIALGASPARILRMVLAQAARLVLTGLVVGILAALGATQFMRGLLFGVNATDASLFSGVSIVVFVSALLSCVIPAVRASRTEPVTVLRLG